MVHTVALSLFIILIFSIYKGCTKNWKIEIMSKSILADLETGVRSLIWVSCAHLINWLLVHNWYLVALVSRPISDGS